MLQQYGETWIVKISDFHRSKMSKGDNDTVSVSEGADGTTGWRSHEICEIARKKADGIEVAAGESFVVSQFAYFRY